MRARMLLALLGLISATLLLVSPQASAANAKIVHFDLHAVNGSGARATATLSSNPDGSLSVALTGDGFTPNAAHAQHIQGAIKSRRFFCPPASADQDGDGQVATEEAVSQSGEILLSLTTQGDTSPDSALALGRMPVADDSGFLGYSRRIPARRVPDGLIENLENLHIVQRGLDVNGNGKYDLKGLGESVFAASRGSQDVPEEATNPAACGQVTPVGSVQTGSGAPPDGIASSWLLALGGVVFAAAVGLLVLGRRVPHVSRGD